MSADKTHVLIIGAGVFGVSTALHLLRDPEQKYAVTLIDRSPGLPAPDAASTDINKIVRTSYADAWYTHLARDAIAAWKNDEIYGDAYHESGVLTIGTEGSGTIYTDAAYQNDISIGCRVRPFTDNASARAFFPGLDVLGAHINSGYVNLDNGWAFATGGVARALEEVRRLGADVRANCAAKAIRFDESGRATGVELLSEDVLPADIVVAATGSWTASTFSASIGENLLATGQCIATIQLSAEQTKQYQAYPVVLDFGSGFYIFPPNDDGVMKMAFHHVGYVNPQPVRSDIPPTVEQGSDPKLVSTPRTVLSHPNSGHAIPREMLDNLRSALGSVYPELAHIPFVGTRMCWYCDTPDTNWLIDYDPKHPGLLFATGGSGHGYKFLPVIGNLVKERIEGSLDVDTSKRFAFERGGYLNKDPSRQLIAQPLLLREEDLVINL